MVIFLSVELLPIAHVHEEERYVVNKGHGVDGFYSVTYYLGFRDEYDAKVKTMVDKICDLEEALDRRGATGVVEMIREYAERCTHM